LIVFAPKKPRAGGSLILKDLNQLLTKSNTHPKLVITSLFFIGNLQPNCEAKIRRAKLVKEKVLK
jgi:hypothetical protein